MKQENSSNCSPAPDNLKIQEDSTELKSEEANSNASEHQDSEGDTS